MPVLKNQPGFETPKDATELGTVIQDLVLETKLKGLDDVPEIEHVGTPRMQIRTELIQDTLVKLEEFNMEDRVCMASQTKLLYVDKAINIAKERGLGLQTIVYTTQQEGQEPIDITFEQVIDDLLNHSYNEPLGELIGWMQKQLGEEVSVRDIVESHGNQLIYGDKEIDRETEGIRLRGSHYGKQSDPNSAKLSELGDMQKKLFQKISKASDDGDEFYLRVRQALATVPDEETATTRNRGHELKYLLDEDVRQELGIVSVVGKSGVAISEISAASKRLQLETLGITEDFSMPQDEDDWYVNYYAEEGATEIPVLFDYSDSVLVTLVDGREVSFAFNISFPVNYKPQTMSKEEFTKIKGSFDVMESRIVEKMIEMTSPYIKAYLIEQIKKLS